MAAPEEKTSILAHGESLFSPKNLFLPLLVLALLLVVLASFFEFDRASQTRQAEEVQTPGEDIDYEIIQAEARDNSGRTVIYTLRDLFDGLVGERRQYQDSSYLIGRVSRWEESNGGLALVLDEEERYRIASAQEETQTTFMVENLSVSSQDSARALVPLGGPGGTLSREEVRSLVREGDIVAVILPDDFTDGSPVLALVLRRFGGVEQLENELGYQLSSPR